MKFWIVGQYVSGVPSAENIAWHFQGVFDTREKAVATCRDANYFIGEANLNESLSHEKQDWPGFCYPLSQ